MFLRLSTLAATVLMTAVAFSAPAQQPLRGQAVMKDASGKVLGHAVLTETRSGVLIDLDIGGLPAGKAMAFHVHEKGVCDGKDGFQSAGGHFNPDKDDHGYHAKDGHHAGDMPNQFVGSDGRLRSQVINDDISLKGPKEEDESLFGPNGTALVLHDKPDDFVSQPAGDAGARVVCGVITRAQ